MQRRFLLTPAQYTGYVARALQGSPIQSLFPNRSAGETGLGGTAGRVLQDEGATESAADSRQFMEEEVITFKKNRGLALVSALMLLGVFMAPAQAQVPFVQSCGASMNSLVNNVVVAQSCGVVSIEMQKKFDQQCGRGVAPAPPPALVDHPAPGVVCNTWINFRMRAKYVNFPGISVISAQAFSVLPSTCNPPLTTSFSNWCSFGLFPPKQIQMVSVTINR